MKLLLIILIFCSCSGSRPTLTVKAFEVIRVYDGYFAAKNGSQVLFMASQDSVYIGRIINVSIAKTKP